VLKSGATPGVDESYRYC